MNGILWEEISSKEQYEKDYGDTPVTKFVRKIVGLDRQAAVEAFSEFITAENLNLQQTKFVELIIDYIVKNGTLDRQALQQDPFTSLGGILRSYSKTSYRKREVCWRLLIGLTGMRRIYRN